MTGDTAPPTRIGRDLLFDFMGHLHIDHLFGVPGTNEIPIIDGAFHHGVTYVPCLHENIALGAAMGWARMTGLPGVVELHVTPGIGHCIGNLFNAHKSHVPLVVFCGQQHSELLLQEPLLASNLVRVAEQYTKWSYEVRSPDELRIVLQRAFKVAMAPPSGPVFLSIPWDFTLSEVHHPAKGMVTRIATKFTGDAQEVEKAARRLAVCDHPVIVAGDGVGYADAWAELAQLAALLDASVYTEPLSSLMNYPNHLPHWRGELPGLQKAMQDVFVGCDVAFLCGFNAQAQLAVYQYTEGPLIPENVAEIYLHNDAWEIGKNDYGEVAILGDIKQTLRMLNAALDDIERQDREDFEAHAKVRKAALQVWLETNAPTTQKSDAPTPGVITGTDVAKALRQLQDEGSAPGLVYVHEAMSDAPAFIENLYYEHPTSYYCQEGGSLGWSMPASLGIQLALGHEGKFELDRTVVNAVGDGSALFYPHVWWTAAKFALPVLYIIMNNREYKTLLIGLDQVKSMFSWPDAPAYPPYLRLDANAGDPVVDFVEVAKSFGVSHGKRVESAASFETLVGELKEALDFVRSKRMPYVLELLTERFPEPGSAKALAGAASATISPFLSVF